jgi:type III secretion target IpaC/SipC family protein
MTDAVSFRVSITKFHENFATQEAKPFETAKNKGIGQTDAVNTALVRTIEDGKTAGTALRNGGDDVPLLSTPAAQPLQKVPDRLLGEGPETISRFIEKLAGASAGPTLPPHQKEFMQMYRNYVMLMLDNRQTSREMSGKATIMFGDATRSQAAHIVEQGQKALSNAIASSVTTVGLSAAGTKQSLNASKIERHSINNNLKLEHEHRNKAADIRLSIESGRGSTAEAASVQAKGHEPDSVEERLQRDIPALQPHHQATLSREAVEHERKAQGYQTAHGKETNRAMDKRAIGDFIQTMTRASNTTFEGMGQLMTSVSRAAETMSGGAAQVANKLSDQESQAADEAKQLIDKMSAIAESVAQSNASTSAAVSGNMRC